MSKHFDFAAIPLPIEYPWILPDYDDCERIEKIFVEHYKIAPEEAKRAAKQHVDNKVKRRWEEMSERNRARYPSVEHKAKDRDDNSGHK